MINVVKLKDLSLDGGGYLDLGSNFVIHKIHKNLVRTWPIGVKVLSIIAPFRDFQLSSVLSEITSAIMCFTAPLALLPGTTFVGKRAETVLKGIL